MGCGASRGKSEQQSSKAGSASGLAEDKSPQKPPKAAADGAEMPPKAADAPESKSMSTSVSNSNVSNVSNVSGANGRWGTAVAAHRKDSGVKYQPRIAAAVALIYERMLAEAAALPEPAKPALPDTAKPDEKSWSYSASSSSSSSSTSL